MINETQPVNKADAAPAPQRKKHTKLLVRLTVIICIVASLGIFLMVWYLCGSYSDFDRNFRQEFSIPGLEDGLMPQGLGNYSADGTFFVSGFMTNGGASRIYVVKNGETVGYVTVNLSDGTVYEGHASGVATNGSKLWLVSEGTVFVLSYSDVVSAAEENGTVTVQSTWDANCGADFCYYYNNYLYVGEFYRKGNYETDLSHRFTTPSGDENTAIILRYLASSSSPTVPSYAYSITGLIQGMAIINDGNTFVLSQSYGLSNSHILVYDASSAKTSSSALTINGSSVTVKYIDSSILLQDYEIPCMSEGLCSVNNRVYVLFESAGDKYKYFVRTQLYNVYSFRYTV